MKNVVRMEIHDDGHGFKVENPVRSECGQRLGVLGMKERVDMVGGTFSVASDLGKETTIRVDIPRNTRSQSRPAKEKPPMKILT